MLDINLIKQQEITDTPLFLFECQLTSGVVERWSTHSVTVAGQTYRARVLGHNLFELKSSLDDGADGAARISLTLANADSYFSQIEWNTGWKGSRLKISFVFFDLSSAQATTDPQVMFQGTASAAEEMTEATVRVTFTNRLNLQRAGLPEIRIQKRCPWLFPTTVEQRQQALDGGPAGQYSPFYRCGYSADIPGGAGTLASDGKAFTSCDFTRTQCVERGMFDKDSAGNATRRFGGVEFVPASVLVRSYGEKGSHASPVIDNEARYNDFVPLVYGTAWYQPPVVFARNDGNLTRMEVLLGASEMSAVLKVIVNDIEIPQGVAGANMAATGWYNPLNLGSRDGGFNPDFTDSTGKPAGDPYGSMAALSVVVPNRISNGQSLPRIQVLAQGIKLTRYDASGSAVDESFGNNPVWVLLDVLRRSGWSIAELDMPSFVAAAEYCDAPVQTSDVLGNTVTVPKYQCNLVLRKRRSAADVVRGIRNGSSLLLSYGTNGLLRLNVENALAIQQPNKPATSNSTEQLNGGWPAYEFSDGSARFSGILRKDNGDPHLRFWSRAASETPNRLSVEFQDEFNEYQQDSLSLVDVDDAVASGQELSAGLTALGLPNFDQASRAARLQLNKFINGNLYIEFGTSVRGFGLVPGDIIAITYEKEGLVRQPFRIVRIAPSVNYRMATITAQLHDDAWYNGSADSLSHGSRRQPRFGVGLPKPLLGSAVDANGNPEFAITEAARESADGSFAVALTVAFTPPAKPAPTGISIPLLSLTPAIQTTGATLAGGQTFYYAVSGVDEQSAESALSFTVKAAIPSTTDTNAVKLQALSFSSGTKTFHVYRGATPEQLVRIASDQAIATEYVDSGANLPEVLGPPDENYDHANFYWRLELQPETPVTSASANSVTSASLTMLANENRGMIARVTKGRGRGQERLITANTPTTISVTPAWDVEPDATSGFVIAEPSWKFGALTVLGPAEFDVPNRSGASVQILGRSANVHDQECAAELSPFTRWRIGGSEGGGDGDIPPEPIFGFSPTGQGTVDLVGVGFQMLANTRSISSGTLTVHYWDELGSGASSALASAISDQDTTLELAGPGTAQAGDVIQIEREVMVVTGTANEGAQYIVERGAYQSGAAAHAAQSPVYALGRRTYIVPFAREFFGSPAGGSYNFPIHLPDVRIAAADFFVTNDVGNSPASQYAFTSTADSGIRTLSGGQYSIQVEGTLAIQNDAAPALLIDDAHAVRDIYAVVSQGATSGDIQIRLKQDGATYCDLTIASGATVSNTVNGFGLPTLKAKSQLTIDIVSVPQDPSIFPGQDLTVTMRL
jgi:hypothetical protein